MTTKNSKLDKYYLEMACIWSKNSYAFRRKVGCLIVKDRMIISDGYNGTPSGFPNVCENVICKAPEPYCSGGGNECYICKYAELKTRSEVLHAEANAITKLARSGNSSLGATLYCTDEPCLQCSKLIIQAGISRVVYIRNYNNHEGIELLKQAGIKVEQRSDINMSLSDELLKPENEDLDMFFTKTPSPKLIKQILFKYYSEDLFEILKRCENKKYDFSEEDNLYVTYLCFNKIQNVRVTSVYINNEDKIVFDFKDLIYNLQHKLSGLDEIITEHIYKITEAIRNGKKS